MPVNMRDDGRFFSRKQTNVQMLICLCEQAFMFMQALTGNRHCNTQVVIFCPPWEAHDHRMFCFQWAIRFCNTIGSKLKAPSTEKEKTLFSIFA